MIVIKRAIISLQRLWLPWFLVGNARTVVAEADRNIDEFQRLALRVITKAICRGMVILQL